MIELNGKYGITKIFTDECEQEAISQIIALINHPIAEDAHVRIMPDVHAGKGCVIGYTAKINDKVCPSLIGVDIGCGIIAYNLGKVRPDLVALDKFIHNEIPHGTSVRDKQYTEKSYCYSVASIERFHIATDIQKICDKIGIDSLRVFNSIGTLGGGNHFIEVGYDGENYWLVFHSGSRNFGLQVANFHQKKAVAKCGKMNGLEYLEGADASEYFRDMEIAQRYASFNRYTMAYQIVHELLGLNIHTLKYVESIHNYINFADRIVCKGAISAHKGEEVVIPWNMRDGMIIGVGKGNEDWNNSAAHGAGRLMSRTKAKAEISMADFEKSMEGIYTTCVSKNTLDESPMAYKDADSVKKLLDDTIEIKYTLKPIYNFKAGE